MKRKRITVPDPTPARPDVLLSELRELILTTRGQVARAVNAGLTMLYWQVGDRIRREILKEKRAEYGAEILQTLSAQLEAEFGRGFSEKNLRRMTQFAEVFTDREIVVSLIRQLTWTHFIALILLKDSLQRDFYAEMCRIERWSVRTLRSRIDSMLFERTALSKKPEKLIEQELDALREEDRLTPDLVFRDPYILDFLGLKDTYSEKDLESAILREIESFLLEFGTGFAFVARQKRITLDGDDYYMDLLFYHRRLRRLVVVELKIGDFKPADTGQVELYLRWLDRHERQADEGKPIALILCAVIHRANHRDLSYRGGQGPIVHLVADLHDVVAWADTARRRWAFSLSNAGAVYAQFRARVAELNQINWDAVAATDFRPAEIKEGKQAEFLVYGSFPWTLVSGIGVLSATMKGRAEAAIAAAAHRPPVHIQRDWYY